MTLTLIYALTSSIMFVLMAFMLNSSNTAGLVLKALCTILAIFGTVVSLANSGIVLSGAMRLV